jgi:hypothetical protein
MFILMFQIDPLPEVLMGTDFPSVLFFLQLGTRRVNTAGITRHPDEECAAGGAQRRTRIVGISQRLSLSASRPGHEVLQVIPMDRETERNEAVHPSGKQPKSERVRRTMGSIGSPRMSI